MRNKRLALTVAITLFVAIVFVASYVMCTVRSVDIRLDSSTGQTEDEAQLIKDKVEQYLGANIFSVTEDALLSEVNVNPYLEVVSVKVRFPSKIVVSLKERKEQFSIYHNGEYYIVSECGIVLRKSTENFSRADGMPIPVIKGDLPQLAVGQSVGSQITDPVEKKAYQAALKMINCFDDPRNIIEHVEIDRYNEESQSSYNEWNRIYLQTSEGVVLSIWQSMEHTEAKVEMLVSFYENLVGIQRVTGELIVYNDDTATGLISCEYVN